MQTGSRGMWRTRAGFLLAVIGSAVGLGNIWRFPFVAYKSGGGAFLIPYAIALFSVGIPLMILEQGLGHKFRGSAPLSFSRIGRRWEFLGWWSVIFVTIGIELYYCVVISWCVNYFRYSFNLGWGSHTDTFFKKGFLNLTSGPYEFGGINWPIVVGLAIIWLINWRIIYRGISRGIEAANKILIPLLALIVVALVVWSLTLPGAVTGVKAYVTPDFTRLTDPTIWSNAFSQVFFSLSLGFGIMVAYASYLPTRANIKTNAFITCLSNSGFEVFAGFAVFATLGYMSFVAGKPIADVVTSGPGLAFVTYPETINNLPVGRHIFGILFFLALIFAGITSSISIAEAATSSLMDKFGWSRKKVTTGIALVCFLGGCIFVTGSGLYWLDVVDYFLNHFGLLAVGFFEAIAIAWVFKAGRLREHINNSGDAKLGKWWEYLITIWIPLVLGVMLVLEFIKQVREPYSGYDWIFIIPVGFGWILMTLCLALYFTRRGWKRPPAKEAL